MSFVESEFKSSPIYANNLVSTDLRTTALLIPLSSIVDGEILKDTITKIRSTMDEYRNDASLFLGGVPMIRNDVIAYITSDLILFSLAVVLIMSIILAIIFHSIRWVLIPIMISVTGALLMTGLHWSYRMEGYSNLCKLFFFVTCDDPLSHNSFGCPI